MHSQLLGHSFFFRCHRPKRRECRFADPTSRVTLSYESHIYSVNIRTHMEDHSIQHTSQLPIMKWNVPRLSSIADAGHVWRSRDRYRSYCTLYLSLVLCSLPVAIVAFAPIYGTPIQCGEFRFSWHGPSSPVTVVILPFDGRPISMTPVTTFIFKDATYTWNGTLSSLQWKSGTQFIAAWDYGYGAVFSSLV